MKGEREVPASAARSSWYQGKLKDIVYLVSSEGHFGSMSSEGRREGLVELLVLSAGNRWEFISRGVRDICELGDEKLSF